MGKGQSVMIVDKGPWGHSGTSGINWGHDMQSNEYTANDPGAIYTSTMAFLNDGMVDQTYAYALGAAIYDYRINRVSEQLGMIVERGEDGVAKGGGGEGAEPIDFTLNYGYFNRYAAQWLKRRGADIYDWTQVLDILRSEDGSVAGAVAICRKDGSAHVFRAKTTVMAMGSFAWISGWNGIGAHTIGAPENTGDGHYILMKAGVELRDMENQPCDFVEWTPLATRQGMGAMGASIVNCDRIYDVDGNSICFGEQFGDGFTNKGWNNAEFMRVCLAVIHDGKGGPNGGIFCDTTDLESQDRYYRRAREVVGRLGYDLPDMVELCPEQWESCGRPFNLDTTSAVAEIPGLYFASGGLGAWSGSCYVASYGSGILAGNGAAAKAAEMDAAPSYNPEDVQTILSEAYSILDANPANGISSTEVYRAIQNTYWEYIGPVRTDEGISAGLAELERIETELIPNMYVPSKTRVMNSEWWKAIEAKRMLMCAQGVGEASLVRKDSRGAHCRLDYPEMDNDNFLKSVKLTYTDGQWQTEVVDIDDSVVATADLAATIPQVGFPIAQQ